MQDHIEHTLLESFVPVRLSVVNESHKHSVPKNSETHFNVIIVSERFTDLSRVKRHRAVHHCLESALKGGVHALTLKLLTPQEFDDAGGEVSNPAPPCLGGSKKQ